jgi:hypothetical protein
MELTEDEAAVYDRQLRVWGVETQKKCARSRLLPPCPPLPSLRVRMRAHLTLLRCRVPARRLTSAKVLVINVTGVTAEARATADPRAAPPRHARWREHAARAVLFAPQHLGALRAARTPR